MMLFRICFLFFLFSIHIQLRAQLIAKQSCLPFAVYLVDNEQYPEAITVIKSCSTVDNSFAVNDSVNYLLGWSYYQLKEVDSSAIYLSKVSDQSAFYFKSAFYAAFTYAYNGNYNKSLLEINKLSSPDSNLIELKHMSLAALYLLMQDSTNYNAEKKQFNYSYYAISQYQRDLCELGNKQKKIKKKSVLKAALLSAIIPGWGKYYAGYKGKALSTLLPSGIMAVLAAEALYRGGLISPPFILFGGVFMLFYSGNIWGSALSPKLKYNEDILKIKHETLLDWHIALRHAFI